jgi:hypothetical protein
LAARREDEAIKDEQVWKNIFIVQEVANENETLKHLARPPPRS